jgi:hypothetical protein
MLRLEMDCHDAGGSSTVVQASLGLAFFYSLGSFENGQREGKETTQDNG